MFQVGEWAVSGGGKRWNKITHWKPLYIWALGFVFLPCQQVLPETM